MSDSGCILILSCLHFLESSRTSMRHGRVLAWIGGGYSEYRSNAVSVVSVQDTSNAISVLDRPRVCAFMDLHRYRTNLALLM